MQKSMKESLLDVAVQKLEDECRCANGSASRGFMDALLKDLQSNAVLADATRHTIYNHQKRINKKKAAAAPPITPTITTTNDPNRVTPSPTLMQQGGRPVGITNDMKLQRKKNHDDAMDAITREYIDALAASGNKKLAPGTLGDIIKKNQQKFRVHASTPIKPGSIRSRARPGRSASGRMKTPMERHEPYLLALCITAARLNAPLNEERFLKIANNLIQGTDVEAKVIAMKKNSKAPDTEPGKALGTRYYSQFMKRHRLQLESARAYSTDVNRQNWSIWGNFKHMYDFIYEQLCEMGIAKKREQPAYMDREGNIVETEDEAHGMIVEYDLLHPELFLHLDETGCNTNMKNDGQVGGRRVISARGVKCEITGANTDIRFTLLPVSNSLGQPVICVLIYQSKDGILPDNMMTGIDIHVTPEPADDDDEFVVKNSGPGKYLPGGPRCNINGIEIPCYVSCSPHGGITSEMLADIFRCLDRLNVYPRGEGIPNPCLLLDGHGSRFEEPFYEYIMDKEHTWGCFVGVPFGTGHWQVGDATQCNGTFKNAFTKAKEELVERRKALSLPVKFQASDIIPMLNKAWASSFGDPSMTMKALSDRGWNPLNRAVMKIPEILATIDSTDKERNPIQMNVDDGAVAELLDELNNRQNKQSARRRGTERKHAAAQASDNLERVQKLAAGKHVRNGKHRLDDDGLQHVRQCNKAKKDAAAAKDRRAFDTQEKLFQEVEAVRAKGSPSKWKQKDCRTMNMCKKSGRDDSPLAKTLVGLKTQWSARKDRPSPQKRPTMPLLPGQSEQEAAAPELSNSTSTEEEKNEDGRDSGII